MVFLNQLPNFQEQTGYPSSLVYMNCFADYIQYFLLTNTKTECQHSSFEKQGKGKNQQNLQFHASFRFAECDCATYTTDTAGLLKNNDNTNSEHVPKT